NEDAACVASLKKAGAVLIGKTAMHEWAYGVTSDNPFFGLVRNPADPERVVGGSSGGSAAAVAAGIVPVALGSDTGGSIRIPASCCGVVGFKPSYDLISRDGGVPQAWSLDHIGPLARSVSDAWAATLAAAGLDTGNTGVRSPDATKPSPEDCALGVLAGWEDYVSQSAGERHARRLERLRDAGARLQPFRILDAGSARAAWLTIIVAESAAYHAEHLRLSPDAISPDVRLFLEAGTEISAQTYLRAQQFRRAWIGEVAAEMEGLDAIVTPTLPDVAPPIGSETLSLNRGETPLRDAFVHFQWPANLLGAPSISLPGSLPEGALPFGLMLTGLPGRDSDLISVALAVEAALIGEQ
ncbi:MAG TPA: amidase, partial [Paracoccaceae bacterium]|nr:amidase [Paracoccaceae bacterium]